MIRDRDGIFGDQFRRRVQGIGIEEIITAPPCRTAVPSDARHCRCVLFAHLVHASYMRRSFAVQGPKASSMVRRRKMRDRRRCRRGGDPECNGGRVYKMSKKYTATTRPRCRERLAIDSRQAGGMRHNLARPLLTPRCGAG